MSTADGSDRGPGELESTTRSPDSFHQADLATFLSGTTNNWAAPAVAPEPTSTVAPYPVPSPDGGPPPYPPPREPRPPRNGPDRVKLALAGAAALVALAVGGWGIGALTGSDDQVASDGTPTAEPAAPTTEPPPATTAPQAVPPETAVPAETAVPPETAVPAPAPVVTVAPAVSVAGVAVENTEQRSVYRDGKIYLEGKVQNQLLADEYYGRASAVLGAANVVNNYVIDPTVQIGYSGTVEVEIPFVFQTGSTAISPTYDRDLSVAAAGMSANPSTRMIIVGHTDNVGDPAKNLDLSRRRAEAVRDYIAKKGSLDLGRFDVTGVGDAQPVADNATPDGRAANRRIAVKITNILI